MDWNKFKKNFLQKVEGLFCWMTMSVFTLQMHNSNGKYTPDLLLSDYFLFRSMQYFLSDQRFQRIENIWNFLNNQSNQNQNACFIMEYTNCLIVTERW